ncbi:MAG: aminotransferase class V-fold PLP-dependent enzyme [Lachnospiraceae bacterium]|nr:aminotransferase class V-fold PLP-dependent enzyme [Lachnospiraceae bacterium]
MIDRNYLEEFAYFGDRIYMDCSAMGMQPERTRRAAGEYLLRFSDSLGRDPQVFGSEICGRGKRALARLVGGEPEDIFFTMNTTWGNNLLAKGLPLEAGSQVLVSGGDFPSVYMPWTARQKEGVELVVLPGKNGVVAAEDMIAAMTERTRVACVSLAQSSSGYVTDIRKLARACKDRGILLSVDAVQAVGRLPVHVREMEIDVLSASSYKGLLGAMGAAFCWCRPEVMEQITPLYLGGNIEQGYELPLGRFDGEKVRLGIPSYAHRAARMETGTMNLMGIHTMTESIEMLLEIGIEKIAGQIREVETYFRERMKEAELPIRFLGSDDPDTWGGSVSFLYDLSRRPRLEQALSEAGIYVTVRDYLRVSFHYYNTKEQAERLVFVLKQALG